MLSHLQRGTLLGSKMEKKREPDTFRLCSSHAKANSAQKQGKKYSPYRPNCLGVLPIIAAIKCYSSSSFFASRFPRPNVFSIFSLFGKENFSTPLPTLRYRGGVCRYAMAYRSEGTSFHIRLIWLPRPKEGNQRHNKSAAATAGPGLRPFVHAYLIFRKSCFSNGFLGKIASPTVYNVF